MDGVDTASWPEDNSERKRWDVASRFTSIAGITWRNGTLRRLSECSLLQHIELVRRIFRSKARPML